MDTDPGPESRPGPNPAQGRSGLINELQTLDTAIYQAVAATSTPRLDGQLRALTSLADNSKLWCAAAAAMALVGGRTGRRAALNGLASIGLASLATNQGFKRAHRRRRPDRDSAQVPTARWVPMPSSTSFPSGHSASAFAFAEGVAFTIPWLGILLRLAATTIAYTRVHSGVHYPGDVVAGSLIGMASGQLAPRLVLPLNERLVPGGSGAADWSCRR